MDGKGKENFWYLKEVSFFFFGFVFILLSFVFHIRCGLVGGVGGFAKEMEWGFLIISS